MATHALDLRVGYVLLALLACNTTYYLYAGRGSEALESVAWYVLLLLFMWEATRGATFSVAKSLMWVHGMRALATAAIAASVVLYVREQEWLDATNLCLWIAVVALLEIEVRYPARVAAHHRAFATCAILLYGALGTLVLVWLVRGEWMDAWDAAVWLTAFGVLELRLLSPNAQNKILN